ncbi:hypothetical protein N8I71_19210 [Roseibacterium sp. SDUM158016]|uniref:hypothetical protein n=1 Tax=Roseicyclus sediminis TaxID=2980997 RepID=UPI0021CFA087|nr:hypothetical protein [Roseibacterium sp. SDUM158016]MCU4654974.1 hypothetical protein [Roseibacterium sp. SDUM158016]
MTQTAGEIYQGFLDAVSHKMMARDYAAVAAGMCYPQTIETEDGLVSFDGPGMMEEAAASFGAFLGRMGATEYHRICDRADFAGGGTEIEGEHVTYILRGGTFVVPPYRNRMFLRFEDGAWRGAGIASAVRNRNCSILSQEQLRAARPRPE